MSEKRYPYIIAAGRGILSNDSYIRGQVKRAADMSAPADTYGFDNEGNPKTLGMIEDPAYRADLEARVQRGVSLPDAKTCKKCGEDAESVCRCGFCPDCEYLEMCDHEA